MSDHKQAWALAYAKSNQKTFPDTGSTQFMLLFANGGMFQHMGQKQPQACPTELRASVSPFVKKG
jgi:hypothetical protein